MDVKMGQWAGMQAPLLSLALLLPLLLFKPPLCCSQSTQGGPQDGPHFGFTQAVYHATVYENSAARTYANSKVKMGIHLALRSWEIRYRITSGDDEGLFKAEEFVLGDFCFLRIRTKGGNAAILNREIQDNYVLTVKASVKGDAFLETWTKVSIQVLDMNDLRPLFSPTTYSVTIAESTPLRTSIAQVTATDADIGSNGEFYYFFKEKMELFAVHPTSGVVSLSGKLNVDEQSRYDLEILAVDRGMKLYGNNGVSSTAKLFVHVERVNEHAPMMNVVTHSPSWLDKNPVYAMVTVDDLDEGINGEIDSVDIAKDRGTPQKYSVAKLVHIIVKKQQIEEAKFEKEMYEIEARDKADKGNQRFSVSTLKIILEDVNDCPPLFIPSVYKAKALEDLPLGTVVAWLETLDPDLGLGGQVRYSLANDYNGWFEVDGASGAIRLTKELDYETQQFYNLTVKAKDKGRPVSLLSVTFVEVEVVDVNENLYAPYFSHFALTGLVKENARIGTTLLQVTANDDDTGRDGEIQYSIRDGSGLGRFAIDEET
ncbi:putative protocadherin Fat 3, partial [Scophthalmus maximus]